MKWLWFIRTLFYHCSPYLPLLHTVTADPGAHTVFERKVTVFEYSNSFPKPACFNGKANRIAHCPSQLYLCVYWPVGFPVEKCNQPEASHNNVVHACEKLSTDQIVGTLFAYKALHIRLLCMSVQQ